MYNNMTFRAQTLIWPIAKHLPNYINDEKDGTKLEKYLNDYITDVVTNVSSTYKNASYAWNVVNEAVDPQAKNPVIKSSAWDLIDNWFCKAF